MDLIKLEKPAYAILIHNKFRDRVLSGEKTVAVLPGWYEYLSGGLVAILCKPVVDYFYSMIEVRHCQIYEITPAELEDAGFSSIDDLVSMLNGMYKKYKLEVTRKTPVTVLRWGDALGEIYGG